MDSLVLPGQLVPLCQGPAPKLGSGIYARDDLLRSSLVGFPHNSGAVGTLHSPRWLALNFIVDTRDNACSASSTRAKLHCSWNNYSVVSNAGHTFHQRRRWHSSASWRRIHGCGTNARRACDGKRPGEDWRLLQRWRCRARSCSACHRGGNDDMLMVADFSGRCAQLLRDNGPERFGGDIRNKRGWRDDGACIVAGDALPEDRAD